MNRPLIIAAILILFFAAFSPSPVRADDAALQQQITELRAELAALKAEVQQMRNQQPPVAAALATTPAATAPTPAVATAAPAASAPVATAAAATTPSTTLWGYGEENYNRPTKEPSEAVADLRRAVLGFGHNFDDKTRVLGELEWEHAVTSDEDQGESEVEQLYIEHSFNPANMRVGLFLIPLGLLNEHHEPNNYYGVERNFVETAIIPSTWREGGISANGNTEAGLNWNVGITTGFNLNKWDSNSDEGRESPLGSIHQELQLAHAHDPSLFAALNYNGMPGLNVGAGAFTGKIGQGEAGFPAENSRLTITEAHTRWQPGQFDFSALYARGMISDTEALNATFGNDPTPVPKSFWGSYVQGAWHAWQKGDQMIAPFMRYEEYNTAASFEPFPVGLGIAAQKTEHVWTSGINYSVFSGVVFKIDYQVFKVDPTRNRLDLGVGYQF